MCDAEDEAHVSRAARWRRFADDANLGGPPPGLYDRLVRSAPTSGTIAKQIDKDLHRTFGSLQGLRVPTPEAMQSLRNVLLAYSLHNPQVGYCQSMNFLAAVLLLIVDEEYSFWCLAAVVERLMPGHFSCCMEMALVDQGVLSHFLRVEDPILVNHLEDLMVAPSLVTTQWLLTCFVGSSLPLRALLRLWDRFFEERHVACLFRIAAALLISRREQLLAAEDTGAAYQALSQLGHDISDGAAIELLLSTADSLRHHSLLDHEPLAALRRTHAASLRNEQGTRTAEQAAAAVAVATATAAEMLPSARSGASPTRSDLVRSRLAPDVDDEADEVRGAASATSGRWREGEGMPRAASSLSAEDETPSGGRADPSGAGGRSNPSAVGGSSPAPSGVERTVVPAATLEAEPLDAGEGWSLVERAPPPRADDEPRQGSSLSYVILQLEAPRLLEAHFDSTTDYGERECGGDIECLAAAVQAARHVSNPRLGAHPTHDRRDVR